QRPLLPGGRRGDGAGRAGADQDTAGKCRRPQRTGASGRHDVAFVEALAMCGLRMRYPQASERENLPARGPPASAAHPQLPIASVQATIEASSEGPNSTTMAILYRYLRHYWKLAAAALVLAAINQIFSLLDPAIFRHIIDSYATRHRDYTSSHF